MVNAQMVSGYLDNSFNALMVSGGGESGQTQNGGTDTTLSGWKDLPMELLLRIISVAGDDRMAIVASGVCTGWRDALGWGATSLSFSWCQDHMNELVISLAHKFTKLQVLSLRQIKPQLEDSAVEAVANSCHDLRELDLSRSFRLSDRSLYALAHGCPHLTRLNISGCSNFSDAALIYLTSQCKNLKCLNLCGCVRAASDRALQAIARNCSQLQSLNLGWCDTVTDGGVTSLASGCPELRAVDLCGCVLITVASASFTLVHCSLRCNLHTYPRSSQVCSSKFVSVVDDVHHMRAWLLLQTAAHTCVPWGCTTARTSPTGPCTRWPRTAASGARA
uniref:F-box/LRR-repeat protein 15-like leucin rich repeat domain-containing protein n=1 Tax=Triticum urartu TaxID=4572 RepID=A0A8R7TZ83_TRIUA